MIKKPKLNFRQPDFMQEDPAFTQEMEREPDPVRSGFLPEHLAKLVYPDRDERNPAPMDLYSMLDEEQAADRNAMLSDRKKDPSRLAFSNALSSWAGQDNNASGQAVHNARVGLRDKALQDYETIAKDRQGLLDAFYKRQVGLDEDDAAKGDLTNLFDTEFDPKTSNKNAVALQKMIHGRDDAASREEIARLKNQATYNKNKKAGSEKHEKWIRDLRKEATGGARAKTFASFSRGKKVVDSLNKFKQDPSGFKDWGALMGGLKFLQQDESVLRKAELDLSSGSTGLMDRINLLVKSQISGDKLSPQQRKDLIEASVILAKASKDEYLDSTTGIYNQMKRQGIPSQEIYPGISDVELDDYYTNQYGDSQTERTVVKTQTSPSTGKKRIIYSDGTSEIVN